MALLRGHGNKKFNTSAEEVFKLWLEFGNIGKVTNHLTNRGEINTSTGKPFSSQTVWRYVLLWILENHALAKDMYEKRYNQVLPDGEWKEFLIRNARTYYRSFPDKFRFWLRDNSWAREPEYKRVWEDSFVDPGE